VAYKDEMFHMYYSVRNDHVSKDIWYTNSPNLKKWSPPIKVLSADDWEVDIVAHPDVIVAPNGVLEMLYIGSHTGFRNIKEDPWCMHRYSVGEAASFDYITWDKLGVKIRMVTEDMIPYRSSQCYLSPNEKMIYYSYFAPQGGSTHKIGVWNHEIINSRR
jgi:hypothetical protein